MAAFNELIKSFEKIRKYMREFTVYGFKSRNEFSLKSERSYDNERRRIENYLSEYIKTENVSRVKRYSISVDGVSTERNPIFSAWEAKSFTKNDIMLHFMLLDILKGHKGKTAKEITEILINDYLNHFEHCKLPDVMTVRNKLNEYVGLGIIKANKQGKTLGYELLPDLLSSISAEGREGLLTACRFFQNTAPVGVLGHFTLQHKAENTDIFTFRHLYMAQALDDEVVSLILAAMRERRQISLDSEYKRYQGAKRITVLPLKILTSTRTGRRYLAALNEKNNKLSTYRLDNISNVEIGQPAINFVKRQQELDELLNKSWGVSIAKFKRLDKVEMTLHIDEACEMYIHERILREGKHGTLEKTGANTFEYKIEVLDAVEMIPWLRTFIGRILTFKCSNALMEKNFIEDIYRMYAIYGGSADGCSTNGGSLDGTV